MNTMATIGGVEIFVTKDARIPAIFKTQIKNTTKYVESYLVVNKIEIVDAYHGWTDGGWGNGPYSSWYSLTPIESKTLEERNYPESDLVQIGKPAEKALLCTRVTGGQFVIVKNGKCGCIRANI